MHRHEMDVGLILDQGLRAVPVVHVPVDDQDSLQPVLSLRVACGYRDVTEQAEAHRPVVNSMMAGRANGAKTTRVHPLGREIDSREEAANRGGGGLPRAAAGERIRVEPATTLLRYQMDGIDVAAIVRQLDLLDRGVATFDVLDAVKELWILAQCARNSA